MVQISQNKILEQLYEQYKKRHEINPYATGAQRGCVFHKNYYYYYFGYNKDDLDILLCR